MLNHAKSQQINEIYEHFKKNKTWFPHIRKDYLARMIKFGNVIFQDGVIIIYKKYKRKNKIGNCPYPAEKGDIILHQILNTNPGSGESKKLLKSFFKMANSPVWLTVRENNNRAINFYIKNGMVRIGTTSWSNGKMPGVVFRYDPNN